MTKKEPETHESDPYSQARFQRHNHFHSAIHVDQHRDSRSRHRLRKRG
jgi:hypothetical protein